MKEITERSLEPYNIEVLSPPTARYGDYLGNEVCLGYIVTTKGKMHFAYYGEKIDGVVYPHLRTLSWDR